MIANDLVTVPWPYLLVVYLVLVTVFVWCMIFLSGPQDDAPVPSSLDSLGNKFLSISTAAFNLSSSSSLSLSSSSSPLSPSSLPSASSFYCLFRINCLNLRLRNFPNYWLLRLLLKLSDAKASLDPT